VVTRHADVLEISCQNALFHNGDRPATLTTQADDARVRQITGGSPHLVRSLVQMDDPGHAKYRALTASWFAPGNVRKLEGQIRAIARAAVERLATLGGRCDFGADFAFGYPLRVIMSILGVPEQDEPRMLMLTQKLFGAADPDGARAAAVLTAEQFSKIIEPAVADFTAYFAGISADRRLHPRDDLATVIANAQVDGKPISDIDSTGYYIIVATAGHDTTSSSTIGGLQALAQDPALLRRVASDPALIPGFVEESIRWTTPVKTFMRSATADTRLGGRNIARNDWLMLCYASANRDETVFDEPFKFRPERKPARHISFGSGAHFCLGQHLAKLEMRILFEELLPRIKSLQLDGEPLLSQSWFVNGPKVLPIRYEMA
ncbi:MAG TPA: cytochrome P450, partial [Steroidobacteraceae bacterium]|nr:cytochrome P450 [Steroidobacteraceae bacterium]